MSETKNDVEIEVFYQLLVEPYAANYINPGQLKPFGIYPAKAIYVYTDKQPICFIEDVAKAHPKEWKRLELHFSPNVVANVKP